MILKVSLFRSFPRSCRIFSVLARNTPLRELAGIINGYVGSLSSRQRYVFMSRYYVNRSIGEIAEKLDLSVSTVKKELASIKAGLKEKLLQEGYTL